MNKCLWGKNEYADRYNNNYATAGTETTSFIKPLRPSRNDTFIDFGCGNGTALKYVSQFVEKAVGLDLSPHQLRLAEENCRERNNISLIQGEFLNCDLSGHVFTKGAARKALHHLNDAEKGDFFRSIGPHFKTGALFVIEDGIFSFSRDELEAVLPSVLQEASIFYGKKWETIKEDFVFCLRNEFPTGFDKWNEALQSGGFKVVERWRLSSFYGRILAKKEGDA